MFWSAKFDNLISSLDISFRMWLRETWEKLTESWGHESCFSSGKKRDSAEYFAEWLTRLVFVGRRHSSLNLLLSTSSSEKQEGKEVCFLRFSPSSVPSNVSNENKLSGGSFILRIACQLLCHLFFPFSSFSSLPDPSVTVYCLLVCLLGLPFTFLFHLPSNFLSKTVHSGITFPFLSKSIVSSFLASHSSLITECQTLEAKQWRE